MPIASYDPQTGELLGTQRSLLAIYQDLNALTDLQRTAIWLDVTTGTPPRWATSDGPNAGTVMALSVPAIDLTGLTVAVQTRARMKLVAAYVLDRPKYLVNPSFDATINVPGWEAPA